MVERQTREGQKMGRCTKEDCRYRAQESGSPGYEGPSCDYAERTGRTRLGQIYRQLGTDRHGPEAAKAADPARCPFYESAGAEAGASERGRMER